MDRIITMPGVVYLLLICSVLAERKTYTAYLSPWVGKKIEHTTKPATASISPSTAPGSSVDTTTTIITPPIPTNLPVPPPIEVYTTTPVPLLSCCRTDAIVVVDQSGGVPNGNPGVANVRNFVNKLYATLYRDTYPNCIKTAFMGFSNYPYLKWDLNALSASYPPANPGNTILNPKNQTYTDRALIMAGTIFSQQARLDVMCKRILLVVAGGSENKTATKTAVQALHTAGVDVCVVSVGTYRQQLENEVQTLIANGTHGKEVAKAVPFASLDSDTIVQNCADCLCAPDRCYGW